MDPALLSDDVGYLLIPEHHGVGSIPHWDCDAPLLVLVVAADVVGGGDIAQPVEVHVLAHQSVGDMHWLEHEQSALGAEHPAQDDCFESDVGARVEDVVSLLDKARHDPQVPGLPEADIPDFFGDHSVQGVNEYADVLIDGGD